MPADIELSGRIAAMRVHGDAAGLLGLVNLEAAYATCAMVLLDAAVDDGIELDLELLEGSFGVAR